MKTALPPFLRLDQWVRDLRIDPINKLVVCIIATHVDCEFVCRTNTKKLLEECGISRQRYSKATSSLSKAGLIVVNKNRRGGRWECNSSIVLCVGHAPSHVAHDDTYHVAHDDIIDEEKKEEEKIQKDCKKETRQQPLEDSPVAIPIGLKIPGPEKTEPDQTQTGTSSLEDSHPHCAAPLSQIFAPQPCNESDIWPEDDVEPVVEVSIPAAPAVESVSVVPVQTAAKLESPTTPVDKGAAILQTYTRPNPSAKCVAGFWWALKRFYFPQAVGKGKPKKLKSGDFQLLMALFERLFDAEGAFALLHWVFNDWNNIRERFLEWGGSPSTYPTVNFIYDNLDELIAGMYGQWSDYEKLGGQKSLLAVRVERLMEEDPPQWGRQFITADGHIDHAALAESVAARLAA
jgi:hypothetical protein